MDQRDSGIGVLLVSTELEEVLKLSDRVAVMYAGKIVERGTVDEIFYQSTHPYTRALLNSVPKIHTNNKINDNLAA